MLAIYCRKSQESSDRHSTSIDIQRQTGQELADLLGLQPLYFVEKASSGKLDLKDRPQLMRMLAQINEKESQIKSVYSYDPSRLYRNDDTKIQFLSVIKKNDVELYFKDGKFNWNDPTEKLLHNILSATNEFFVDITSQKIKDTLRESAKKGKATSGVLPYGYTKDEDNYLIIHEEEAEIIRLIFDKFGKGETTHRIQRYLNANNVPTRYNKIGGKNKVNLKKRGEIRITDKSELGWCHTTILRILRNPIYKGERKWGKEFFDCPAIIGSIEWEKVNQSYLNQNKGSLRGKSNDHVHLLTNLLSCSCGKSLVRSTNGNGSNYSCASKRYPRINCGQKYVPTRVIDGIVTNVVYGNLYDKVKEAMKEKDTTTVANTIKLLQKEIEKDSMALNSLADYLVDGTLDKNQYQRQRKRVEKRISTNTIKLETEREKLLIAEGKKDILEELEKYIIEPTKRLIDIAVPQNNERLKDVIGTIAGGVIGRAQPFANRQKAIKRFVKNVKLTNAGTHLELEFEYKLSIPNDTYFLDFRTTYCINPKGQIVYFDEKKHPSDDSSTYRKRSAEKKLANLKMAVGL